MGATDLTRDINQSLSSDEVTNDLSSLKQNLSQINEHHKSIDSSIKLKLK
jgi:hypothetical protein